MATQAPRAGAKGDDPQAQAPRAGALRPPSGGAAQPRAAHTVGPSGSSARCAHFAASSPAGRACSWASRCATPPGCLRTCPPWGPGPGARVAWRRSRPGGLGGCHCPACCCPGRQLPWAAAGPILIISKQLVPPLPPPAPPSISPTAAQKTQQKCKMFIDFSEVKPIFSLFYCTFYNR